MSADLRALAERVMAATGHNVDLDIDIHFHLKWPTKFVPAFTASLDAALTLVPEGLDAPGSFKVESFYLGNGIARSRAAVWDGLGSFSSLDTATEAAAPALALTAAALLALATMPGER